jgi:PAS domain S-box-containing protein
MASRIDPATTMAASPDMDFAPEMADALLEAIRTQFIMSITDASGRIVEVNDAFCAISQYSRADLIGADHSMINSRTHPRDFFTSMWRTIRAGESWRGEICNRARDGSLYWVDSVITPMRGPDGKIDRFVSIRSDISRRKFLEHAVMEPDAGSVARLYQMMPAKMYSIDMQGRMLSVSDRWLDKFGYAREEVIGRRSVDFLTPESRDRAIKTLLPKFFAEGYVSNVEVQVVCKDGRVIDVLLSAMLEHDADGTPLRSRTVMVDVTPLKRAEREAAEERARYGALIDEHTDMVSLARVNGELTYVNQSYAAQFRTTPDRMVGTILYDHVAEADRAAVRLRLEGVCASGNPVTGESRTVSPDGRMRWIAWVTRPLRDSAGHITGLHSVGRDITERKNAETRLQQSNQIFALAADAAGIAFWDWNVTGNMLAWDNGMYPLYGRKLSGEANSFEVWSSCLHPDDRARAEQDARDAAEGKRPYRTEFRVVHPNGQIRHIAAAGSIAADPDNGDLHMFGVNFDITERKQFEAALLDANDRFAIAADAAGMGVWNWNVQTNSLEWDDWMYRLYGRARAHGEQPFALWAGNLHPDDKARSERALFAAANGTARLFDAEFRVIWPDGQVRHIKAAGAVRRGADGRAQNMFGINFDITERKQFEEKLRDINERFAVASRAAGLGFWEWNIRDGTFTADDTSFRLWGRAMPTSHEDAFAAWQACLHPDDREPMRQATLAAAAEKRQFDAEYRAVHPNGDIRYLRAAASVMLDQDGNAWKMLGLALDVTDRKQTEQKLQQLVGDLQRANAEVESFAYIASHDLKAPLRGIRNLTDWIAEDLGETASPDTQDNLKLIQSRIARMSSLMDDLLTYARAGRDEGGIVEVNAAQLVADIFDLVATIKPIRLETADLPVLRTRRAPLDLVLRNLIGNAIKHHDDRPGVIKVSARPLADGFEFAVADDGPGIPPEHQQRVFGLFQTLRSRDEIEGSGMGLSIVKKTVESMRGQVTLDSDGKHGCIFRFTWPASDPTR